MLGMAKEDIGDSWETQGKVFLVKYSLLIVNFNVSIR
jgi:hypothetical protein